MILGSMWSNCRHYIPRRKFAFALGRDGHVVLSMTGASWVVNLSSPYCVAMSCADRRFMRIAGLPTAGM